MANKIVTSSSAAGLATTFKPHTESERKAIWDSLVEACRSAMGNGDLGYILKMIPGVDYHGDSYRPGEVLYKRVRFNITYAPHLGGLGLVDESRRYILDLCDNNGFPHREGDGPWWDMLRDDFIPRIVPASVSYRERVRLKQLAEEEQRRQQVRGFVEDWSSTFVATNGAGVLGSALDAFGLSSVPDGKALTALWRKTVATYHPDNKVTGDPETFKRLQDAYKVLKAHNG